MAPYKFKKLSHKEVQQVETLFAKFSAVIKPLIDEFPRTHSSEGPELEPSKKTQALPVRLCPGKGKDATPARSLEELQQKLQTLKGKPSLPYREKLQKKSLKARLKKREKKEKHKIKRLEARAQAKMEKSSEGNQEDKKRPAKPVYNTEGEMVFSKFDFSSLGTKAEKPRGKVIKDPVVALRKVRETQKRLKELEEGGEVEKVAKIKEKKAWKTALLKAEGVRVKDDPDLLKTSIKKIKKRKEKSKAKWKANLARVEKDKEERQRKRTENLQARSRAKKLKKLKSQAKRGRVIAGF